MTPDIKRRLYKAIGTLPEDVPYDIDISPRRLTRSNRANAYWHAVPVEMFREALAAQGQHFTHDQCHEWLRDRFIDRVTPANPKTGEPMEPMPASSRVLDGPAFYDFVERVREWMEDSLGIVVPDPGDYGIKRAATTSQGGIESATSPDRVPRPARGVGLRLNERRA